MSLSLDIVTICFNNIAGLRNTVESVLSQTEPPNNLFIVDGGSSDGTPDWLLQAKLPRYVSSISEPDSGIYDAMNKGLLRSRSELVMMLNSGDRLADPGTLEWIAGSFEAERWAWAYGDALMLDPGGRQVGLHQLKYLKKIRFFGGFATVPHQATVLSRSIIQQIGRFRLDLGLSADQEFLLRAWRCAEPAYLPRVIAHCDNAGVSSRQEIGAFGRQMRHHRSLHGIRFWGHSWSDNALTALAVGFDAVRSARGQLRAAGVGRYVERGGRT